MAEQTLASTPERAHSKLRWLGWIFLAVLALATAIICFIILAPEGWLRQAVGSETSGKLGRGFAVDGDIHISWDWTTPYIELNQIHLANLENAREPDMVSIDHLGFHIKIWNLLRGQLNLPDITIAKPTIILEKTDAKTKNWEFPALSKANVVASAALPSQRSQFPIIGKVSITDGTLAYRDKTLDLDTTLKIGAANGSNAEQIELSGEGALQKQPFRIDAKGGSLNLLRYSSAEYPLDLDIKMGGTEIKVNGTFTDPVKMQGVNTKIDIHGDNLADLFYLTNIPLPPTPVYSLNGQLVEQNNIWALKEFHGRVGGSDLSGSLTDDNSGDRSFIKAELISHQLRMEDLRGLIGAQTESGAPPAAKANDRLLPDIPLNLTRLRASDMDIDFKATEIAQPGLPVENMDARFRLKDGVMRIDPLSFGVADGTIAGMLILDGQNDIPKVSADLSLKRLSLKPFFTNPALVPLSSGRFGGRFKIEGTGKSLADVLADGNGRITLMMAGGTLSKLIVDAAGLDAKVATGLFGKDQKTDIRCAITDFGVQDGQLASHLVLLDTKASKIDGALNINLKNESLEGHIQGHPKEITVAGQIPITFKGKLKSPSIGLDPSTAAVRGGAAAALSVFLTPLGAVLPFIDLDPAKDSDCSQLLHDTTARSGVSPPPAPKVP